MTYNPAIVVAYFEQMGLPKPKLEFVFAPGVRKFRFDFAWPESRTALEVQGGVWNMGKHGRGSGIVKDMEKSNFATLRGWKVLYCLPRDVATLETAKMIDRAITLDAELRAGKRPTLQTQEEGTGKLLYIE
jgi:hypothetical protein